MTDSTGYASQYTADADESESSEWKSNERKIYKKSLDSTSTLDHFCFNSFLFSTEITNDCGTTRKCRS